MSKNMLVFIMSPFPTNEREICYQAPDITEDIKSIHTNQAAVEYLLKYLERKNEKLDKVFAFVSKKVKDDGHFERFTKMFADLDIEPIDLHSELLTGAMGSISDMYDVVMKHLSGTKENCCLHFDLTGGPRHAATLMLPLIQMFKYQHVTIGKIIYSNVSASINTIEDASELLESYSLISGAEEFLAFGSIRQIKKYFTGKQPQRLEWLLNRMENLSEAIRVSGSYETMSGAIIGLNQAINNYENALASHPEISAQERFFSKLLPRIKNEYGSILPKTGANPSQPEIIRWCVNKGFLQQAMAFYTEWMPKYLVDQGLLTVTSQSVIDDCVKNGKLWSSWEIFLLRSYTPLHKEADEGEALNFKALNDIFHSGNLENAKSYVKDRDEKLYSFLLEAEAFAKRCTKNNFVKKVFSLPEDNRVREALTFANTNKDTSLERFLNTRAKKESTIASIIVKALGIIPRNKRNIFFSEPTVVKVEKSDEDKSLNRRKVIETMLDDGLIKTTLSRENLLIFVEEYCRYVDELRNKFSHANSDDTGLESNNAIADAIVESIDRIA